MSLKYPPPKYVMIFGSESSVDLICVMKIGLYLVKSVALGWLGFWYQLKELLLCSPEVLKIHNLPLGWTFGKWVILYSYYVGTNMVWVLNGVLHFISHPYCLIRDKDYCLSIIRISICCGRLHNWYTFDWIICIRVWGHIILFTCVVHDDAISSTYNSVRMRLQFYLAMYNGNFYLFWDIPPYYTQSRDIAPHSRFQWGYSSLFPSPLDCIFHCSDNWKIR